MSTARNALNIIAERFGQNADGREITDNTSIGVTSARIAPKNPTRVALIVMNLSANDVYVRPTRDATTSAGVLLKPNGGSFVTVLDEDLVLPTFDWFAVASGASSTIYVLEVVLT